MLLPLWGNHQNQEVQAFQSLIISALAFSLMTVCVKKIGGRLPVAELIFIRSVISLAITRFLLKKQGVNPWGSNKKLLLIRGLAGTGALFCIFKALFSLPIATATVIQYSYPTFTAIAAKIFLKESIRKRILIALILGWIGITLVAQPLKNNSLNLGMPIFALGIALIGAILTAFAYVCVRKLSEREHPLVIVHYFPLISAPICLPILLAEGVLPTEGEWIWLLGIGLFTQIGQQCITDGLRLLPAAHASSINYTQVIFAAIWGVLIFAEPLNRYLLSGAICVFGATLISVSARADLDLVIGSK
ncbi:MULTISPECIES: DMT family transporter [Prochlorococcus]|uniref:DMT family transporter n=1 Tax=Prochlorococcus TaxID=1218 RepID=UPI000533B612|nr:MULTISPECIES: DMT family transporter [Prochlorococcus]KGG12633.1 Integral membrane protein [Prochlorococcus sp. MIT 0601]